MDMQGDNKTNIIRVTEERWKIAQEAELELWKKSSNKLPYKIKAFIINFIENTLEKIFKLGEGDDWNYWWAEKFNDYSFLPQYIEKALEIGCGPFTNIKLISPKCEIGRIYLNDPLIKKYVRHTNGFTSFAVKAGKVCFDDSPGEELPYKDNFFDLVILINVLDHVMDAERVITEACRATKKGGILLLGQDLTNEEDVKKHQNLEDIYHPIRMEHNFLDKILAKYFETIYYKILPREEGRNPEYHYATYIFAGCKK